MSQVDQLCSIIPMLNNTISRQNAIIDKLVESLDQKNKELEQTNTMLTEIKTLKEDIKNVKQSLIKDIRDDIKENIKAEISRITLPTPVLNDKPTTNEKTISNNDTTLNSKPTMSKEEIFAANMRLNISPEILEELKKLIGCLYIAYDSNELIYGVALTSTKDMQKFAKMFNLTPSANYDWLHVSNKDIFTHGNSSFVVPYKWREIYFPNVDFETKFESSALKYIRDDIYKTEIDNDVITIYFRCLITRKYLYDVYAKSLSTTFDQNETIKLSVKQYADFLEQSKI